MCFSRDFEQLGHQRREASARFWQLWWLERAFFTNLGSPGGVGEHRDRVKPTGGGGTKYGIPPGNRVVAVRMVICTKLIYRGVTVVVVVVFPPGRVRAGVLLADAKHPKTRSRYAPKPLN